MKKKGDCYQVHADAILGLGDNKMPLLRGTPMLLCHGSVWHPESGRHGHCWLELNEDLVLDISNGHRAILRRARYYEVGHVENVIRYTAAEVREKLLKHGKYGPWEKEDSGG